MDSQKLKQTPLYSCHVKQNAKLVPFNGWEMPLSYEGSLAEHEQVRTKCGVFDVSHMGEIFVRGPGAKAFLQFLTINDIGKLTPGTGQYSAMLNKGGGVIDDLILYQLAAEEYLLCVNAGNIEKDFAWIAAHSEEFDVAVENESEHWSQLAVQGPLSPQCLAKCLGKDDQAKLDTLPYMGILKLKFEGETIYVARTGYTGEKGYEVYLTNSVAQLFWQKLFQQNADVIKPIGLGARDSLRLEACYLLYGNDMDETVSPLEAGISWAVRLEKGDFVGKQGLLAQKDNPRLRKMVAFVMEEKSIPRHGMNLYLGDQELGRVTSGGFLPTLGTAGGMALVYDPTLKVGDTIEIDVRGKRKLAKIVKRPLYSANVK